MSVPKIRKWKNNLRILQEGNCLNRTLWDILGQFRKLFDEFGALRLFSQSYPTIFSHYRPMEKHVTDGWTSKNPMRSSFSSCGVILKHKSSKFAHLKKRVPDRHNDGPIDQRTDRRTYPFIEMGRRI